MHHPYTSAPRRVGAVWCPISNQSDKLTNRTTSWANKLMLEWKNVGLVEQTNVNAEQVCHLLFHSYLPPLENNTTVVTTSFSALIFLQLSWGKKPEQYFLELTVKLDAELLQKLNSNVVHVQIFELVHKYTSNLRKNEKERKKKFVSKCAP